MTEPDSNPRCPLCNNKPMANDFEDANERWRVSCCNCGLSTGPHDTDAEAWAQWEQLTDAKARLDQLEKGIADIREVLYPEDDPEAQYTAEMADDISEIVWSLNPIKELDQPD